MRPELTILEQIDHYLTGKLSAAEATAFEQKIANDSHLEQLVNQQKDLIRAVNRKALRAEINAIAGASGGASGGGLSNLILGIGGVGIIGLVTASIFYFSGRKNEKAHEETDLPNTTTSYVAPKVSYLTRNNVLRDTALLHNDQFIEKQQPETIFSSVRTYEKAEFDTDFTVETKDGSDQNLTEAIELVEVSDKEEISDTKQTNENEYLDRSREASFPGGNSALKTFIDANLRYPKTAQRKEIEAVIRVDFLIDVDGRIEGIDASCIRMNELNGPPFNDVRRLMNKKIENLFIGNATHVLRTMPNWLAAKNKQGNQYASMQRIYFKYDLTNSCSVYQLDEELPQVDELYQKKSKRGKIEYELMIDGE